MTAFTKEAVSDDAPANIMRGSSVISDRLACFKELAEAGMPCLAVTAGGGWPEEVLMHWLNG